MSRLVSCLRVNKRVSQLIGSPRIMAAGRLRMVCGRKLEGRGGEYMRTLGPLLGITGNFGWTFYWLASRDKCVVLIGRVNRLIQFLLRVRDNY